MNISVNPSGYIEFYAQRMRCALGRGGLRNNKREGDGATPIGHHKLGRVFYRPDRCDHPPATGLTTHTITPDLGWCDDPEHADYNRLITLPHSAHHETLWRDDHVYDVIVEILYNINPIKAGLGSAIFMHVAKPDYSPTEGCIALKYEDLLSLLQLCNEGDAVVVPAPATASKPT